MISWESKELSRVFSNTAVKKHQFFGAQPSLWSNSHIHIQLLENHSFAYMDICPQSDVSAVSCVVYETVADFVFLGSKIIADNDIAMKLRHLLLGRKAMTNLEDSKDEWGGEVSFGFRL